MPKSRTFTGPPAVTNRFSGFKSRWTIPTSCATARPRAACTAISTAVAIGSLPRSRRSLRVAPVSSSVTAKAVPPDVEDRQDVGMGQGRERLGLALEARQGGGVLAQARGQDLDRHAPPEPAVERLVDLAHAAFTELLLDLVGPQDLALGDRGGKRGSNRALERRLAVEKAVAVGGGEEGIELTPQGRSPPHWESSQEALSPAGSSRASARRTLALRHSSGVTATAPL